MLTKDNVTIITVDAGNRCWELIIKVKCENFSFRYRILEPYQFPMKEWIDFANGKRQMMNLHGGVGEGSMSVDQSGMCNFHTIPCGGESDAVSDVTIPFDILSDKLRCAILGAHKKGFEFL